MGKIPRRITLTYLLLMILSGTAGADYSVTDYFAGVGNYSNKFWTNYTNIDVIVIGRAGILSATGLYPNPSYGYNIEYYDMNKNYLGFYDTLGLWDTSNNLNFSGPTDYSMVFKPNLSYYYLGDTYLTRKYDIGSLLYTESYNSGYDYIKAGNLYFSSTPIDINNFESNHVPIVPSFLLMGSGLTGIFGVIRFGKLRKTT